MSTQRPGRVGLVVDHPLRDLHGLVLVAHLLAQRGLEAVLMPFYGQHLDLGVVQPDLLVLNYARPANLALIRAAQARGIRLAVLDTEGGLLPDEGPTSASGMAAFLRDSGLDGALALYMFWGEALRDAVVANTALPPERAVVTGCPRFDLAHAPWARPAAQRRDVLVNTNFPIVNALHARGTRVDRAAMRAVGFDDGRIAELTAMVGRIMDEMIAVVGELARARPDRRFILRPHPFESAEPYRQAFAASGNIMVRQEGNVLDALAEAACLLHVNCTTAIEAGLCGVAPVSLDFVNDPAMLRLAALPTEVSHRAGSLDQALAMIDDTRLPPLLRPDIVEPHFGPADGQAAHRAADAIDAVLRERVPAMRRAGGAAKHRALDMAGRTLGSVAIEGLRQRHRPARRGKALEEAEVARTLRRFADAQGRTPLQLRRVRTSFGTPSLSLAITPPSGSSGQAVPVASFG